MLNRINRLALATVISLAGAFIPHMALAYETWRDSSTGITWTYSIIDGKAKIDNGYSAAIPSSTTGDITIPSMIGGYPVTSIGDYAFFHCYELTSVAIPSGVTSIGEYAFWDCSGLASVTIPASVTNIGANAFPGTKLFQECPDGFVIVDNCLIEYKGTCSGAVEVPNGVRLIADNAFSYGCRDMTSVSIPSSVMNIGYGAFSNCSSLTNMVLPFVGASRGNSESADSLFGYIFGSSLGSGWTAVTQNYSFGLSRTFYIPSSLKTVEITDETVIGFGAFQSCSMLVSVNISSRLMSIGDYAFSFCSGLTTVTIPASVTSIGAHVFNSTKFLVEHEDGFVMIDGCVICYKGQCPSTLVIPATTHVIAALAFYEGNYKEVTSVTIPPSVTSVGGGAFGGFSVLTRVDISDLSKWCSIAFEDTYANPLWKAKHLYLNGEEIKDLIIPNGVESIGGYAFYGCEGITSVRIPSSVTHIGVDAFSGTKFLDECADGLVMINGCVIQYKGLYPSTLVIPNSARMIADSAFFDGWGCKVVSSVSIPPSVTSIGRDAFAGCSGLTQVNITSVPKWCEITFEGQMANPLYWAKHLYLDGEEIGDLTILEGVKHVNAYAFYNCSSLTSVMVPLRVESIGECAFAGCGCLKSVTLSKDVAKIEAHAFEGCSSLRQMLIPASVREMSGSGVFKGCSAMERIEFAGDAPVVNSSATDMFAESPCCLYVPRGTIGWDVDGDGKWCGLTINYFDYLSAVFDIGVCKYKGGGALRQYLHKGECPMLPLYEIPPGYVLKGWDNDPTLPLSESMKYTLLLEIDVGEYSEVVDGYTWQYRKTPQGAVVESGHFDIPAITPIPEGAVSVPETLGMLSVVGIGEDAFCGCGKITSIKIPETVTFIGPSSFRKCVGIQSFVLPGGITEIGYYAFDGCSSLERVNIPDGVSQIGFDAFRGCVSLADITIPQSVLRIDDSAFLKCDKLGDGVVIRDGCVLTVNGACSNEVDLPDGVRLIAGGAFRNCQNLRVVRFPTSLRTVDNYAFSGCSSLASVGFPQGLSVIGDYSFKGCSGLKAVSIPPGVERIGSSAFGGCTGLTEVMISQGVEELSDGAFAQCENLTSIELPDTVRALSSHAFYGCVALKTIVLPKTLTLVPAYAFYGCRSIDGIILPDGVLEIQDNAFAGCSGLREISIPSSVNVVGNYAFEQCLSISSVELPRKVGSIGYNAFDGCRGLVSIVIPKSVQDIGRSAFNNCSKLSKIIVDKGDVNRVMEMIENSKSSLKLWTVQFVEREDSIPELMANATKEDVDRALSGSKDWALFRNISDGVAYGAYFTWAQRVVDAGFVDSTQTIKDSETAWISFALDADKLLAAQPRSEDLRIEEFMPVLAADSFECMMSVKGVNVGSEALKENLEKVFGMEGAEALDDNAFKTGNVEIEFERPENGNVRFTARPKTNSGSFFMRARRKE